MASEMHGIQINAHEDISVKRIRIRNSLIVDYKIYPCPLLSLRE